MYIVKNCTSISSIFLNKYVTLENHVKFETEECDIKIFK